MDSIRLLLHYKRVPHAEFYVDNTFPGKELSDLFQCSKLPAALPYFCDSECQMTGSRAVLDYLAKTHGLSGNGNREAMKIASVVDFCYSVLQVLWRADCHCGGGFDESTDMARARFLRDRMMPLMQSLALLVEEVNTMDISKTKPCRRSWVAGEVRIPLSTLHFPTPRLINSYNWMTMYNYMHYHTLVIKFDGSINSSLWRTLSSTLRSAPSHGKYLW